MAEIGVEVINRLLEIGKLQAQPFESNDGLQRVLMPDGRIVVVTPKAHTEFAAGPFRVKAAVEVRDVESFVAYWKNHHDEDSVAFADRETHSILGVLDYHKAMQPQVLGFESWNQARWCNHRVTLKLKFTEEWATWKAGNGAQNKREQGAFAEFIEDNAPDVFDPPAATMMEMATTLQATTGAQFEQATNLQNGQIQLSYREEIKGTYGANKNQQMPKEFKIRVPVYEGEQPVTLTARIRYRISGGRLTMWYDLLHVERTERKAFDAVVERVAAGSGEMAIRVYNGKP